MDVKGKFLEMLRESGEITRRAVIGVRSCFLLAEIRIGVETGPGNHQGSSRAWLIPNGNCSAYRIPLLCGEQDCPARKGEGKKQ